jgi:KDO2-lipid IV(A) lauroyltransferase
MAGQRKTSAVSARILALRYRVEAALFFAFMAVFRALGVDRASALGGWIGRNILARTGITSRARDNLEAAYPDKGKAEIDAILAEMWDNLGRTVAEYPHLDKFRFKGPDPRIEVVNIGRVKTALDAGKGVIFLSGHFANWEIMPITAADYGVEGGTVYRPVNNPYVDAWMVKQRTTNGPREVVSKGSQGTRRIFTLLRGGKSIFILVDQKTNEGIPVPFFGRMAMTTPAPAVLALKVGAVLLPVSNERMGGARFRVTVHEPIEVRPSDDHDHDVLELTQRINEVVEGCVRARPSQWLWIHRRWPKMGDKPRSRRGREAQDRGGSGVVVESDGSSFS